jgi:hypothetical protein
LWRRARWGGALRLVRLGEEGVKILEVNTELRGGKLYATIRAVVDGVEEVYKIQILPPARPREVFRSTREGRGGKGEGGEVKRC